MNKKVRFITQAAIIAAIYAVLTLLTLQFSSYAIQVRVAESLCVLICYTPAAIPGMFVGCLISNIFSGTLADIIFGSLATLVAGLITAKMPKKQKKLYPIPTVVVNTVVVPFILYYGYGITSMGNAKGTVATLLLMAGTVCIGEVIACFFIGLPLIKILDRIWPIIGKDNE